MVQGAKIAARVVLWSLITSYLVRKTVRTILRTSSSYAVLTHGAATARKQERIELNTAGDRAMIPWTYMMPPDHHYAWVVHWKDREPTTFGTFELAKQDLLQELWFFSREYIDADPDFAEQIMAAWSEVLTWKEFIGSSSVRRREFSAEVAGFKYYLTRMDEYKEKYADL